MAHDEHSHQHHHPGHVHPPAPLHASILRMSVGERMAVAVAVIVLLWLAAIWATW